MQNHDVLERGLAVCLAVLADLARDTGQSSRASRLREAVDILQVQDEQLEAAQHRLDCPLTAREHEVAGLIMHGLTNRQIGERLVITERTAETHLQNILAKLGLASRVQVAVWFADHATGLVA